MERAVLKTELYHCTSEVRELNFLCRSTGDTVGWRHYCQDIVSIEVGKNALWDDDSMDIKEDIIEIKNRKEISTVNYVMMAIQHAVSHYTEWLTEDLMLTVLRFLFSYILYIFFLTKCRKLLLLL